MSFIKDQMNQQVKEVVKKLIVKNDWKLLTEVMKKKFTKNS